MCGHEITILKLRYYILILLFESIQVPVNIVKMQSYRCQEKDTVPEYAFKGEIVNHMFKGPAMLKFKDSIELSGPSWKHDKQTCFTFPKLMPEKPDNVIGTWTNGMVEGPVKISGANSTIIAEASAGILHGVSR